MWSVMVKPKKLTPKQLEDGANDYFEYCRKNPWLKQEMIKSGDMAGTLVAVPTERPYTIEGLCNYLNINRSTFDNYSKQPEYEKYFSTCARIRQIIDNQHLEGGMVGAFNSNIVMRKLGLAEKTELKAQVQETEVELDIG